MELATQFAQHINHVQNIYERALSDLGSEAQAPNIDAVLLHSGSETHYFGDDRHVQFEAFGHFRHWLPLDRPEQMVLMRPGRKPTWFQVIPSDFWYEQTFETESWWTDCFDIVNLESPDQVIEHLGDLRRIAYMGDNSALASNLGLPANLQNERHLTNYLDFYRGMKTPYEVAQLREANRRAMISHEAAARTFFEGGSEFDIHQAYLAANQLIEHDLPYTNIIGLDEKAAILHYQHKRRSSGRDARLMLIDAGMRVNGYAADITRTHLRENAHPIFHAMHRQMDALQLELVAMARPGVPYVKLHEATHAGVIDILMSHDILRGNKDELLEQKVGKLFFPHGIGHLLGLQVHDVGGFFADDHGKLAPPPEDHQFLRLNREMCEDMVFTIEPGLYFIPVLLEPQRNGNLSKYLNWGLVDELTPCGGIRIEDNIVVTSGDPINLTR